MKIGLDTNVLVYFAGVERAAADRDKVSTVRQLLGRLYDDATFVMPTQVIGELFNVLVRTGSSRDDAHRLVSGYSDTFATEPTDIDVIRRALDLAVAHRLQIWDAIIVNACAAAGCTLLLSEDMQDGFRWRGMTVTNPFTGDGRARLRQVSGLGDLAE